MSEKEDSQYYLDKIHIEQFNGTISKYNGWKSAFHMIVYRTVMGANEKIMRSKQSRTGKTRLLTEDLQGYNRTQYEEALWRVERDDGFGERNKVAS